MIRLRRRNDEGFALVFVMLVTTMIMLAVATTLTIVTPNIRNAKTDQDAQSALAAAQAGIDDFVAYLLGTPDCRSTTRVCQQALGANSADVSRSQLAGTDQQFHWHSDPQLTADYDVRVHSTGTSGAASRSLVADVALERGILSFGYYTDYESQSPAFLYDYFAGRHVYLSNAGTYGQVNAYDTHGSTVSVTSPTTMSWNGPPLSGTNPYPANMCGQHWYYESPSAPGRYSYGTDPVWGETGTIGSHTVMRNSGCDVVFTTGMTFDGPIYSRDALLISDQTRGGIGPIFNKDVLSLWGYRSGSVSYATPTPSAASPWRQDNYAGGLISSQSPQRPATATFDLRLPDDIGTEGLPDNYCVYTGPTRVKLNGDGTASVTSPQTTSRAAQSDSGCYPSGSLAGGIVNFTLDYQHVANGTIYVKDLGTEPGSGWPQTQAKSTVAATKANSVFYLDTTNGATTPDQPDSSVAPDTYCSSTVKYKNTASYPCAWTNVATTTDVGTGSGWTAYTSTTKCNAGIAATNRQLFECEYSHTTGATTPPANRYAALRSSIQSALASGTCLTGTTTVQRDCLTDLVNSQLQTANSGQHPANYGSPASGDHRYVVTGKTVGSSTVGTAQSVGSAPAAPMADDDLFTSTSAAAQEAATKTPITLTVSRQTYTCSPLNLLGACIGTWGWNNTTPQFTTTVTQSDWAITSPASSTSYFPNTSDVTQYGIGTSGASKTDGPGDLYVEGDNQGQLSLVAQHDIVLTGDIDDPDAASNDADAVDLVAGNNVRNYHPVKCGDQTASDINNTSPGWCPNDITGLYRGALESNGVLDASHPAKQYANMESTGARHIDAAVFALSGSFLTDNYNRGDPIGTLTVNGGLYQSHRGANGVQWEFRTTDTKRATSCYSLQYHYVDLQHSDLPYTPPVNGDSNSHIWTVVSMSSDGSP